MTTTFTPGDAVGVCGPAAHLIAAIELDDPRLPRLWELLSRGAADTVDEVLHALLEGGFTAMPAFALASTSGTTTRVVVRHPAVIVVTVGDAVEELTSTPGGTWSDVVVEGASAVVLRASEGTASGVQLPFHAGMAPASAVRLVLAEDAGTPAGAEPATAQPVEVAPEIAEVTPDAEVPAKPAEEPAAKTSEVTPHTAIWRGSEATESEPADHEPGDAEAEAAAQPDAEVEAEVEARPEPSDEPEAMTVMRPAVQPP
ncbi:hypothetical protein, partial [Nocardioides sp.]|uniref:hypothetical protein n=1 Tax=Nocardioides sp. TaxID=35761 RepID=UPI002CCE35DF